MKSIIDILEAHVSERPTAKAITFLSDGEIPSRELDYADLLQDVSAYSAVLRDAVKFESRIVLALPVGLDAIVAFLSCITAGIIPVLSPPLHPRDPRPWRRMEVIAKDCGASAIIATAESAVQRDRWLAALGSNREIPWLAGPSASGSNDETLQRRRSNVAFIQYTSGSTATPKGIQIGHDNLAANLSAISQKLAVGPEATILSWLPLHHDMGLVGGILTSLWCGAQFISMSPMHFAQKPVRWLTAISRFKATHSGGPNFAYDLCVRRAPPDLNCDLSSWETAFCGAEPIRPATVRRFCSRFRSNGFRESSFYPCYGLAESTLFVSGHDGRRVPKIQPFDPTALASKETVSPSPIGREIVSCGSPAPDHHIAIVDSETRQRLGENRVGEVWLKGPSVSTGYWPSDSRASAIFSATTDQGEMGYLQTGDLGFLHNSELYIVGRSKEVIIWNGRKIFPSDVEQSVESISSNAKLGAAAAFEAGQIDDPKLTILLEVAKLGSENPQTLLKAIAGTVAQQHEIAPAYIGLVGPGALPRTTSGKLRRGEARDLLKNKALPILADTASALPWVEPLAT